MLYKCQKLIECSASTNNIGQKRSSITAVILEMEDIELIIVKVAISAC